MEKKSFKQIVTDLFRQPLNGETRLWKLFWFYTFVILLIGQLLAFPITSAFAFLGVIEANMVHAVLMLPVFIWLLMAYWACAFNQDSSRFQGYIIRFFVILATVLMTATYTLGLIFIFGHQTG